MYKHFFKRLIDLILSIVLLPFMIVLFLVVAIAIKLEDKGPVFYTANRLGKDEKIYKMYKFRTMKVDAPDLRNPDGSTFNSEEDPRLLKTGKIFRKTSIDEVPQILNVLIGNMSIIGPRPDLPEHIEQYTVEDKEKLTVLPGLTGFNQAYFRNSIEWSERKKNDVYYAQNISFLFDCRIFLKTVQTVLFRKNVFLSKEGS
ncbi:UDP-phosphate galactose phosphotransferase [Planococcus rifietoensis]|uniref:UDP-phosphate galactose phosphotransferase n=1 Tax=Planococcus rifietoensis TaxID=200991 RepID=A0A0U2YP69_9BACL|nr:sugar transferase [Planococcus rifietoensis]ALS76410.1 UDP-phosphate galactose phosphotransferase [Planococcus rifietoensis]